MSEAVVRLTGFGRALRDAGLPVGSGRIIDFCRAAAALESEDLYWIGRVTLVGGQQEIAVYNRVFWAYFGEVAAESNSAAPPPAPFTVSDGSDGILRDSATGDEHEERRLGLASSQEVLRRKSFSECSDEELEELFAGSERLIVPTRRSRRYASAHAGAPDFRRTLRASFRTAGEPLERAWRARRDQPRRMVLLLDVSGSMASYSRALLFFAYAAVRARGRWEVFCFATRLTQVTRVLAHSTPNEAIGRAADKVLDWDGGTRIAESLKTFLDVHGHGGLARGATVIVCSDGLERGDPEVLEQQMARLSRLAHCVVWLNPHKESPNFEPLARGMRAALPYIDVFTSGHNLVSVQMLMRDLSRSVGRMSSARSGRPTFSTAYGMRHDDTI